MYHRISLRYTVKNTRSFQAYRNDLYSYEHKQREKYKHREKREKKREKR